MLATARDLFAAEGGLDRRVELVQADITALPDSLAAGPWDAVSCMWTLHQLPDVQVLGAALRQIAAVRCDSGAALWISDFARLKDPSACPAMLQCVDPDSPAGLRQDAIASEAAAFTREELSAQLAAAGLGGLSSGHATPLPYLQAYWRSAQTANLSPLVTAIPHSAAKLAARRHCCAGGASPRSRSESLNSAAAVSFRRSARGVLGRVAQ